MDASHVTSVLPFPSVAVAETKRGQHGAGGETKKRTVHRFHISSLGVSSDVLPPLEITNSNGLHHSNALPLHLSTFRPRAYQYHQHHQHLKLHNIINQVFILFYIITLIVCITARTPGIALCYTRRVTSLLTYLLSYSLTNLLTALFLS